MALHINFVSPPSSGKSTLSSELFSKMKKLGYKVELVTEVAKDYVYKKDFVSLSYQPIILGKQSFKNFKLDTQKFFISTLYINLYITSFECSNTVNPTLLIVLYLISDFYY